MKSLEQIRTILREHDAELRSRYGLRQLAVFGSYSRGSATEDSDIDILVDVDPSIGLRFVSLAEDLEQLLGMRVDLVSRRAVRPDAMRLIEKDLVSV
jgi:predicted nucleotidyltransferase